RGKPGDVGPPQPDPPAVGPEGAADQVEERGLAGAVRSHDAEDGSGGHFEADISDRSNPSEGFRETLDGQQRQVFGLGGAPLLPQPPPADKSPSAWSTAAPDTRAARWRSPWARPAPACR